METNLNIINITVLVSMLLTGGLLPGMSSLLVLSRTASSGVWHGVFTMLGIILGDIVYVIFAIFGLAILATNLGALYELLVFIGGAYLIWLGTQFWQQILTIARVKEHNNTSLISNLFTGLLITLGDQKAIFFYLSFFPVLFDLSGITLLDNIIIIVITFITLAAAKLSYVFMGMQVTVLLKNIVIVEMIHKLSGGLLIMLGSFIMFTT